MQPQHKFSFTFPPQGIALIQLQLEDYPQGGSSGHDQACIHAALGLWDRGRQYPLLVLLFGRMAGRSLILHLGFM